MTTLQRMTVSDLMSLPDDGCLHELVRGEILRMPPPSGTHARVEYRLAYQIGRYLDTRAQVFGWDDSQGEDVRDRLVGCVAVGEAGIHFSVPDDPDQVRGADICYLSADQVARYEETTEGKYVREVPVLVAEVIGPSERAKYIREKVADYLAGGARLVWLLTPAKCTVQVHRPDGTTSTMASDGVLSGEDILPGFSVPVARLFPRR